MKLYIFFSPYFLIVFTVALLNVFFAPRKFGFGYLYFTGHQMKA